MTWRGAEYTNGRKTKHANILLYTDCSAAATHAFKFMQSARQYIYIIYVYFIILFFFIINYVPLRLSTNW